MKNDWVVHDIDSADLIQVPPPVPAKATNGASSWGAPASSAPSPSSGGGYRGSSGSNGSANGYGAPAGGGNDSERMARIEAKLDKIMRHLGIS